VNGGAAYAGYYHGAGYVRTIPGAYRPVVYGGYNCYYAAGIYYRPSSTAARRFTSSSPDSHGIGFKF